MIRYVNTVTVALLLLANGTSLAEMSPEVHNDSHYNDMGFFDIHICNWSERPNFFKVLFSSTEYEKIESMNVYKPDGTLLVSLDKTKFRILKRKNKAEKHVFMLDIDVPETATTGWYEIDVKAYDGQVYKAKDFVVMTRLEKISDMRPSGDSEEVNFPVVLNWQPVTGSKFYLVFVRDVWTGEMAYQSKLISDSEITIPDDKLEPGGYYSWAVHARDTNEHVLLGDFHMGSMSKLSFFTVAE